MKIHSRILAPSFLAAGRLITGISLKSVLEKMV